MATKHTVSFKLNLPSRVTFTIQRSTTGRRVKAACVAPTKRNASRKRCTRLVALRGSFARTGVAGPNRVRFSGRLAGRRLAPGNYKLVITPSSAAGTKGKAAAVAFRIIR